ncbi:MAG: pitrilysin family protein, partial [Bacilli bacterium]
MMKQLQIKKTNDVIYCDVLDNGLQVFMVPKTGVNTTFASLNVNYGAMHNEFIPSGEKNMQKVPNGIAHFLEHKMFEQENGVDPMMFYAANGADVNAYTSLYNTAYHFSCSSHLTENLSFLLDFVQAPYFTDENVLKEQGIIEEEIRMYADDPYSFLDEQIRWNAFSKHSIRIPIAGSISDVKSITKEDLYRCYKTFYQPSNMFLVISGNFKPETIIDVIRENQSKKTFANANSITLKQVTENDEVVESFQQKEMNVEVPKIAIGIKIPLKKIKMEAKKRDIYLAILFDSLFGATSLFNEKMKNKGYLLSYASIETIYTNHHLFVTISADTDYASELIDAIKEQLINVDIDI